MSTWTPPSAQQYPHPPPKPKVPTLLWVLLPLVVIVAAIGGFGAARATANAPLIGNDSCKVALKYSMAISDLQLSAAKATSADDLHALQSVSDDLQRLQDRMEQETGTDRVENLAQRCDEEEFADWP